jgi:hypothetical protein
MISCVSHNSESYFVESAIAVSAIAVRAVVVMLKAIITLIFGVDSPL